jgi:hypothetical protein
MSNRPFRRILWSIGCAIALMIGLFWTFRPTEPVIDSGFNASDAPNHATGSADPAHDLVSDSKDSPKGSDSFPPAYPEWPQATLEGEPAKQLLLDTLTLLNDSFSKIPTYTVTFRKQERLKGKLVPEQSYSMKVRQTPFAVYLRATIPASGKEVIFAKGFYDDKVIAHSAGLSRWLVPKLQVPPEHPLVRSESRHPITNAGIGNLIRNLIGYRQRDLGEPEAETKLDHWTGPDGRHWLRSLHLHHQQTDERPFSRVEVLYHVETRLPLRFTGFDWPDSQSANLADGSPILGEYYVYDDLSLNAPLAPLDFDPANPAYHFHRF